MPTGSTGGVYSEAGGGEWREKTPAESLPMQAI